LRGQVGPSRKILKSIYLIGRSLGNKRWRNRYAGVTSSRLTDWNSWGGGFVYAAFNPVNCIKETRSNEVLDDSTVLHSSLCSFKSSTMVLVCLSRTLLYWLSQNDITFIAWTRAILSSGRLSSHFLTAIFNSRKSYMRHRACSVLSNSVHVGGPEFRGSYLCSNRLFYGYSLYESFLYWNLESSKCEGSRAKHWSIIFYKQKFVRCFIVYAKSRIERRTEPGVIAAILKGSVAWLHRLHMCIC